jgi:hypothetical protein
MKIARFIENIHDKNPLTNFTSFRISLSSTQEQHIMTTRTIERETQVANVAFHQTVVLSDGSEVHNMRLDRLFLVHFPTEADRDAFEDGLRDLFDKHTLDQLIVRYDAPVAA